MRGVMLPSSLWLNLDAVLGVDFRAGVVLFAAPGVRGGAEGRGEVAPAQLRLEESDLDTLWDYLLGESVSLGDHRQRAGWAQPKAGNLTLAPLETDHRA